MFKYSFRCDNEVCVRSEITNMMMNDLPIGKSLLGKEWFRQGIHFTECGEKIKGFYLSSDECDRRGVTRIMFSGKFVETAEGTFFNVYIHPKITELIFLLIITGSFLSTFEPLFIIVSGFMFIMFVRGYIRDINETVSYLNAITTRMNTQY